MLPGELLLQRWDEAASRGVLRTDPARGKWRVASGSLGLLITFNPLHRATKRPAAANLTKPTLREQVPTRALDESPFNFSKAKPEEFLCGLTDDGVDGGLAVENLDPPTRHAVLVNIFPLMRGHMLFVFDLPALHPQVISVDILRLAIATGPVGGRDDFSLGFNSAGAWSSVDHCHFQGYWINEAGGLSRDRRLPVTLEEREELFRGALCGTELVISSVAHWPMYCFAIEFADPADCDRAPLTPTVAEAIVQAVWTLISILQTDGIAHNILLTWRPRVVAFVFPRQSQQENGTGRLTEGEQLRFAVAEVSGLIVTDSDETFHSFDQRDFEEIMHRELSIDSTSRADLGMHSNSSGLLSNQKRVLARKRHNKNVLLCHSSIRPQLLWPIQILAMGAGCSASPHSAYDPAVLSLAHYEIHRVVGQGGFGKVNAVIRKQTQPPQWFALKTLSKAVISEKKCAKMIWNERNLLAAICCPHIVAMHHAFQDTANCYVLMDLFLGGDIKYHLSNTFKGGVQEQHARFYVAGLLLALRYLHSLGILHRDVKPDNVILDSDGYPRLTDLGISVSSETLRYKGNSGTTSYMAPEMFIGSNEHGVAADFYALGIMTSELLFGRKLWSASALVRLEEKSDIINGLPLEGNSEYYPRELLDESTSSPISRPCRAFLRAVLYPAESGRLGFKGGADEVMDHDWFSGFAWTAYEQRTMTAPFIPLIDENHANCNTAAQDFDDVLEQSSRPKFPAITPEQQDAFVGFEFNMNLSPDKNGAVMKT